MEKNNIGTDSTIH